MEAKFLFVCTHTGAEGAVGCPFLTLPWTSPELRVSAGLTACKPWQSCLPTSSAGSQVCNILVTHVQHAWLVMWCWDPNSGPCRCTVNGISPAPGWATLSALGLGEQEVQTV